MIFDNYLDKKQGICLLWQCGDLDKSLNLVNEDILFVGYSTATLLVPMTKKNEGDTIKAIGSEVVNLYFISFNKNK